MSLSGGEKAHRLQQALEYAGPTHRLDDLVQMLRADPNGERIKLFENQGGVIVAEIDHYPLRKAVNFWLVAGELRDCLALEHDVLPWGIEHGCTVATGVGRPGWGRAAAKTGWRPWRPSFFKPLVGEG